MPDFLNNCDATFWTQTTVVVFAALSGVLWLLSAKFGLSSFMDTPMGSIDGILRRQTRYNSAAALAATVAAFGQALLVKMPSCASHLILSVN